MPVSTKGLEDLLARKNLRSADRAALHAYLEKLRQGRALDYVEKQNLTAYLSRYGVESVEPPYRESGA